VTIAGGRRALPEKSTHKTHFILAFKAMNTYFSVEKKDQELEKGHF
jgi:hypothetical protein